MIDHNRCVVGTGTAPSDVSGKNDIIPVPNLTVKLCQVTIMFGTVWDPRIRACLSLRDPDLAVFVIDLLDANKKLFFFL